MELFITASILGFGIIVVLAMIEEKQIHREKESVLDCLDIIDDEIDSAQNDKDLINLKHDIKNVTKRRPINSFEKEYGRSLIAKIDDILYDNN